MISRSNFGQALLEKACLSDRISLTEINCNNVMDSQALHLVKRRYSSRAFIAKMLFNKIPIYNQEIINSTKRDFLKAFYTYYCKYISSHENLWSLIDLDPFILMKKIHNRLFT